MKKTALTLALAAMALSLSACGDSTNNKSTASAPATSSEKFVLKVAHFWPPTAMSQKKILEPWCVEIAQKSNDRLRCQIYPAMQLGGTPAQLIDQAIDGVADIVWTLPGYTAGRFPSMEVMELPFLTKDAENGSRVAWRMYQQYGQKDFEKVRPLSFNVHDRGQLHNNVRPITNIDDLKGLKMRAPTRLTNKLIDALGATPVAMPMPAVPDAVAKGVIDGYILPWEVVPTIKLDEMTKYHSEINPPEPGLYTTLFTIAMNKVKYDSLPADLQKIIDDTTGEELAAKIGKTWDETSVTAREKGVQRGNQFNTIDHDNVLRFEKAATKVEADWIKDISAKGYDGQAMVDRAKALIKELDSK